MRSRSTHPALPHPTLSAEDRVRLLPVATLALIAAGGALHLAGEPTAGNVVWAATVVAMLVPLTVAIGRTLASGRVGVDAIALVAMAGALAVGEFLAGAVIALMLSGGNALEATAARRARRELTALLERMPTVAHRRTPDRGRGYDRIAEKTSTAGGSREVVRPRSSAAAVVGELASSGAGEVLAVVACRERRAALGGEGVVLADAALLEAEPELAERFEHVVLVDPPQFAQVERLATAGKGYAHLAWGEPEHRFALAMLDEQLARRDVLIALFRDLRDAGETEGDQLRGALRGSGRFPRAPESAARCVRVLAELDLLRGTPAREGGGVGVVSSERTELERSAAYRAYGARHQEGLRFLERRKSP
jgi:hypothetical protein